jgi:hypothetical protein
MSPKEAEEMVAKRILSEVARVVDQDIESVRSVVATFARELHRHALEYEDANGDFIGEHLLWQIDQEAYFHLIGFLEYFAERYNWESGTSSEYLLRLNSPETWERFSRDMETWKRPKSRD